MTTAPSRLRAGAILLILLGAAILAAPALDALPGGISSKSVQNGCNCHGATASDQVTLAIDGLPDRFAAGESYRLELSISGGPEGGENLGGFNLLLESGNLTAIDDSVLVQSDGSATHTMAGNDRRHWTVDWTAPHDERATVEGRFSANAVNGDGNASDADLWSTTSFTVSGRNAAASGTGGIIDLGSTAWWLIIGLIIGLVTAIAIGLFRWRAFTKDDLRHWLTTTDHKDIGILYLWTSAAFALIGMALSVLIRMQLIVPDNDFMVGDLFNQAVTMHGAVMVLFAVSPMSFAFANHIVPLQIGAKDMAFPRLNAFSFWALLLGGLTAASGFFLGGAADVGWTFYAPLTSIEYSPGAGVSLAGAGLVLLVLSVSTSTVNFLVTILRHRTPDMPMMAMPMFTWNILFTVILMLIVFPALLSAVLMLIGDRVFSTLFFDSSIDGATWWLHIFWFFGHPEVYIVLLPGLGMAMEIVPTFVGRPLYGRRMIIWSLVVASVISVLVWGHHMFLTGIDPAFRKIETIGTELVSVPFGVIYLCLLATFHRARPDLARLPLAFVLGAIGIFLIGGITGVYLASVAMDVQLRGTYYVVAHFHYTLGSVAIMTLAGIYYWYPKMFGRLLGERLGWWHFWLTFLGVNITFIPLFGLWDMPRRIYVYGADAGWDTEHLISTFGSLIVFVGQVLFAINVLHSMKHGRIAGDDPWGGSTLEWSVESPPATPAHVEPPSLVAG